MINPYRPSWDIYFLGIADAVALRGDCRRSQVGAVLVQSDNHTIFIGYNGTEKSGQPGCLQGACPRGLLSLEECPPYSDYRTPGSSCIAVHAEENALRSCLRNHGDPWGCTIYITREPCSDCKTLLHEHGVAKLVWSEGSLTLMPRL